MPETDFHRKINLYQETLNELPPVNFNTLRKLLDHLKDVTENSTRNKATIANIAKVFGPTLLSCDKVWSIKRGLVVFLKEHVRIDVTRLKDNIFRVICRQLSRKKSEKKFYCTMYKRELLKVERAMSTWLDIFTVVLISSPNLNSDLRSETNELFFESLQKLSNRHSFTC